MAQTAGGTYYAASSELVSSWPATSLDLANQLESRFAAKAAAATEGLTLISANTLSAVSGVNINNCFSSTYENYLIEVLISAASTNSQVRLRLRASGTDSTTNYAYANRYVRLDASASGTGAGSSTTGMQLAATQNSSNGCSSSVTVIGPNKTQYTKMFGHAVNQQNSGDVYLYTNGCMHTLSNAYDGCSVTADSGTITGTVRVYGYHN